MGALFAEAVPIFLNNLGNIVSSWFINILADLQILLQFVRIIIIVKFDQVIPSGTLPGEIVAKKTIEKICIFKNTVVDIIGVIRCFVF